MYRHGNSVPDVITDALSFRCEYYVLYTAYVSIIGLAPCLFLFLVWRERSWRVVRNRYLRVFRLKGRRVLRVRPHRRGWGRWRIEGRGSSGLATNSISFCLLFVKKKHVFFICLEGLAGEDDVLVCSSQQVPFLVPRPLKGFLSWQGTIQGP